MLKPIKITSNQKIDDQIGHQLKSAIKKMNELRDDGSVGFFELPERKKHIKQVKEILSKHPLKKILYHVGIGGSSLGPRMLRDSLQDRADPNKKCYFIENIDSDEFIETSKNINWDQSLFFIVSKSGTTIETLTHFNLLLNLFLENGHNIDQIKNHFIFCSTNNKGDLFHFSKKYQCDFLEIDSDIGGRFSVLGAPGLFTAHFLKLDTDTLLESSSLLANDLLRCLRTNGTHQIFSIAKLMLDLKEKGITQTVLMPYSSRLETFGKWFIQLWSESLNQLNLENKEVGLCPLLAIGPMDQHSQLQMFCQGPRDKLIIFLEIDSNQQTNRTHHALGDETPSLSFAPNFNLEELRKAQLKGTLESLEDLDRPYLHLLCGRLNESSLGELIVFFEALTAMTGLLLEINPFIQPGVELSKQKTKTILKNIEN